ncbi:MFS transporter [Bifidobacterium xylocopae]|uniref:MFS transporter n=1 Tax=Bifidobacterium xylocopae TaxID=2493119 RepID=A0A366KBC0_9BIFI|nr:MFS transporter [Bifidobacterium xylocopae]RBP99026.1 MFS transporter [Bifidobacterium xylocopae]
MSTAVEQKPPETPLPDTIAPDSGRPLTGVEKVRFGLGFALFSIIWMTAGTSGSQVLLPQRFTDLGVGVPEAILGTMNSVGCVFALLSNVIFGALSDMSRSRLGKRTPWIVAGGVVTAAGYLYTAHAITIVTIVIGWCMVQVGVNMMIAPAVAVLSDRIPEATRGTFSALYGGGNIVGQSLGTLIGAQFIQSIQPGFIVGVCLFAVTGIVTVIIWPRERSAFDNPASMAARAGQGAQAQSVWHRLRVSFTPPTRGSRDFYLALGGRLFMMVGTSMVATYQLYILQKYCGLSVKASAAAISTMSVISMIVTFCSSIIAGPISDKLRRRKIIVVISSCILALGIAIPWVLPTALGMMLYAGVAGVGSGIYTSVDQALNVDVLPSKEEAGKDLGILNLANTLGQVIAPVLVSLIVIRLGYSVIFPVAIAAVLLGAAIIMLIRSVR